MNRMHEFMSVDWQAVRRAGELAATAKSPGDLWSALADLFPEHQPYGDLPAHLKSGTGPEAALAVLVDGLRDAANALLQAEHGGPDIRYVLGQPDEAV